MMHTAEEEEFENHSVTKRENFKNMKTNLCCKLIEWTIHLGLLFISGYFVR